MEEDRIDKTEYKETVRKEKTKLAIQVAVLALLAVAISLTFFITLKNHNPYTEANAAASI